MKPTHVPRVEEITGKKSKDDIQADRDWLKARKILQSGPKFGTIGAGMAWRRQIEKTRSF